MPDPAVSGPLPDDLPRREFTEPLRVTALDVLLPEPTGSGQVRITFRATVRDAAGRRCPDLAVEATIAGPERSASGMAHTDLLGQVRFRMTGPDGSYRIEITDVAAGALRLDRDGSQLVAAREPPAG